MISSRFLWLCILSLLRFELSNVAYACALNASMMKGMKIVVDAKMFASSGQNSLTVAVLTACYAESFAESHHHSLVKETLCSSVTCKYLDIDLVRLIEDA